MITVADLKDQIGTSDHTILYCECCGAEYSANKGDYFMYKSTFAFVCCDHPMKLVSKRTVYQEVR